MLLPRLSLQQLSQGILFHGIRLSDLEEPQRQYLFALLLFENNPRLFPLIYRIRQRRLCDASFFGDFCHTGRPVAKIVGPNHLLGFLASLRYNVLQIVVLEGYSSE